MTFAMLQHSCPVWLPITSIQSLSSLYTQTIIILWFYYLMILLSYDFHAANMPAPDRPFFKEHSSDMLPDQFI